MFQISLQGAMNEETKHKNGETLRRIAKEAEEIQMHSIALDLPGFEDLVTMDDRSQIANIKNF